MPHEARILMNEQETLLDVCINSHMAITGSSDPLTTEEADRNRRILGTALRHWKPGRDIDTGFDEAVRQLCTAALWELNRS